MEEIRVDIRETQLVRGGEVCRDLQLDGQFTGARSDHGQWRVTRPFFFWKGELWEPRATIKLTTSNSLSLSLACT